MPCIACLISVCSLLLERAESSADNTISTDTQAGSTIELSADHTSCADQSAALAADTFADNASSADSLSTGFTADNTSCPDETKHSADAYCPDGQVLSATKVSTDYTRSIDCLMVSAVRSYCSTASLICCSKVVEECSVLVIVGEIASVYAHQRSAHPHSEGEVSASWLVLSLQGLNTRCRLFLHRVKMLQS